jgi:hypothetical protein
MLRKLLVICILFTFPMFTNVFAQDAESYECSTEDVSTSVSSSQEMLQQAQAAITAGNIKDAMEILSKVESENKNIQAKCKGWNFEGNRNDAIGPLELEAGLYIVEYKTSVLDSQMVLGIFGLEFENVEKDEMNFDSVLESYTKAGEFTGRKTVRLEGGKYLISLTAQGINQWSLSVIKP